MLDKFQLNSQLSQENYYGGQGDLKASLLDEKSALGLDSVDTSLLRDEREGHHK